MAYGCTITVASGKMSASQSNFIWVATEDNFPTAAIDGGATSILNGGGNLRCYTDDTKTTQIPIEVIDFTTGVSPSVIVWGRSPTLNVGSTVYIEADDVETTQPAVTDPFGRNAVWQDFEIVAHLNDPQNTTVGGYTNSTGGSDGTGVSMSASSGISLYGDSAAGFDDSDDYIDFPLSGSYTSFSRSMWVKCANLSNDQRLSCLYNSSAGTNSNVSIAWMDAGGAGDGYRAQLKNSSSDVFTVGLDSSNNATTDWQRVDTVYTGTNFIIYVDGVQVATTSANGTINSDILRIGRIWSVSGSDGHFGGFQSTNLFSTSVKGSSRISDEYNNESDPATFWSTSAWEDQSGFTSVTTNFTTSTTLLQSLDSDFTLRSALQSDITNNFTSEVGFLSAVDQQFTSRAALQEILTSEFTSKITLQELLTSEFISQVSLQSGISSEFTTSLVLQSSISDLFTVRSSLQEKIESLFTVRSSFSSGVEVTSDFTVRTVFLGEVLNNFITSSALLSEVLSDITLRTSLLSVLSSEFISKTSLLQDVSKEFSVNVSFREVSSGVFVCRASFGGEVLEFPVEVVVIPSQRRVITIEEFNRITPVGVDSRIIKID